MSLLATTGLRRGDRDVVVVVGDFFVVVTILGGRTVGMRRRIRVAFAVGVWPVGVVRTSRLPC